METVWYGAMLVVIAGVCAFVEIRAYRRRRYIAEHGEPVIGWIVMAPPSIYNPRGTNVAVAVLISFQANGDERVGELAHRLGELSERRPATPDEKEVFAVACDDFFRRGYRRRLPKVYAGGLEVYVAHVFVSRKLLPGGFLQHEFIRCCAMPGDSGEVVMDAPPPAAVG